MEIELEISETEDYSEFPNQDFKTVEIISKNKQEGKNPRSNITCK